MSLKVKFLLVRNRLEQDGFSLVQIKDAMNNVKLNMSQLISMEAGGVTNEDLINYFADQMKEYIKAKYIIRGPSLY